MRTQRVYFLNKHGNKLAANFDWPEHGDPVGFALYAHCFTCSKNLKTMVRVIESIVDGGFAVFRFDFTGIGESEGDFSETNLSTNIDDLIAAAEYLAAQNQAPQLLLGHSLGGATALMAAGSLASVAAVATIAAPYDPSHLSGLLADAKNMAANNGVAEVVIGGTRFRLKKQFFDDLQLKKQQMSNAIRNLDKALLIMHSPKDTIVPIEQAGQIFRDAKHPKSFISLDPADHLLSDINDARFAGSLIATWAKRYLHNPATNGVNGAFPR